jgi:RNA polymerase sigma factor for flagellar operon FliA
MPSKGRGASAHRAYSAPAEERRPTIDMEATTFGPEDGLAPILTEARALDAAGGGALDSTAERDAMVLDCLPLVKYIAIRMSDRTPRSVELDDLIGEGTLGLLDAARRFDPARGIKFRTFAEQRIRGAMLDHLRSLDWVPRTLRQKQKEIDEAYHAISARHGRAAGDEEVAEHLGVPLEDLHKSLDELKGINLGSFEDASGDGEGMLAYIPDHDAEDPQVTLHENEFRRLLAEAIEGLPEKERLAVQMYYYSELSMKEIGAALGITESRVSQLHTKAMLRLRGRLKDL